MDATLGRPMYREVGYGIEDVWDDMVGEMEERAPTTLEDLSQRVTDLSTTLAQDTQGDNCSIRERQRGTDLFKGNAVHLSSKHIEHETLEARDPEPQDGPADAGSSLVVMCGRMFLEESDEVEKYVGDLPDMIQGSVMVSKPKKMQDAIEFATKLMDQKIRTLAERQAKNKRKFEDTSSNNQNQQQPFKRHNVARAYTAGPREKKPYGGSKPLCPKCNYHHDGQCAPKCANCKRTGHLTRDCRSLTAANNNQRAPGNQGNQVGNGNVVARAYAVGNAGKNPDANVVTGTFLLNNRNASILFDTGADRSFVSTAFSSLIDIVPFTLDHDYDVELADGKIIGVNTIIRGCTLNFINHPFNIDLMPVELGSLMS
ncbi:putative reverse transcriptase domain-containing protein [Tanacetum coccineum]